MEGEWEGNVDEEENVDGVPVLLKSQSFDLDLASPAFAFAVSFSFSVWSRFLVHPYTHTHTSTSERCKPPLAFVLALLAQLTTIHPSSALLVLGSRSFFPFTFRLWVSCSSFARLILCPLIFTMHIILYYLVTSLMSS